GGRHPALREWSARARALQPGPRRLPVLPPPQAPLLARFALARPGAPGGAQQSGKGRPPGGRDGNFPQPTTSPTPSGPEENRVSREAGPNSLRRSAGPVEGSAGAAAGSWTGTPLAPAGLPESG